MSLKILNASILICLAIVDYSSDKANLKAQIGGNQSESNLPSTGKYTKKGKKSKVFPPKVQVVSVEFKKLDGSLFLSAKMRNDGPGNAELGGSCKWECPFGTIVRESGGIGHWFFLKEGQEVSFDGTNSVIMCDGPPATLLLDCRFEVRKAQNSPPNSYVDPRVYVIEWSHLVNIPR